MDKKYYWSATTWWQLSGNDHVKDKNIKREENEFDVDEGNQRLCDACFLPIFSTPYESSCSSDDNENIESGPHLPLHKCCANLPPIITIDYHHSREPLHLHKLFGGDRSRLFCFNCRQQCQGYFYQCSTYNCRFTLDIKCATTIKIVHRSHKHGLTFIPKRKNLFTCGGCGLEHEGQFYGCEWCDFYLHRDCALLHNTILHKQHADIGGRQHPLTLSFNLSRDSFKFMKSKVCSICNEDLSSIKGGICFCTTCDYATHVKCATQNTDDFHPASSRETAGGLPHFPMKDDDTSLIQYLEKKGHIIGRAIEEKKLHDHNLIVQQLNENENENGNGKYICNACIDPIIINNSHPSFYTCSSTQCTTNPFYLHRSCAAILPFNLQHPLHLYKLGKKDCKDDSLVLLPKSSSGKDSFSMFDCSHACEKYCNGFVYNCMKCEFKLDVKCAVLPDAITYELHGKSHILFLSYKSNYSGLACNCCGNLVHHHLFYRCSSCPHFTIDVRCVLLPSSVSHKYDRHPLKLTPYDESSTPKDKDSDFCEICEEGMATGEWFYHCNECITSFHINCIPCVGLFSKVKFGGTIRVHCHDCPLVCIRLLNNYSYTCDLCEQPIPGRVENTMRYGSVAFECTKCGFWLDYGCAEEEWIRD